MDHSELIKKLSETEDKLNSAALNAKNASDEDMRRAAKADVRLSGYHYKTLVKDLSVDEKRELEKQANDMGIKLPHLFELAFTEEEKEGYNKTMEMLNAPLDPELEAALDAEDAKKKK